MLKSLKVIKSFYDLAKIKRVLIVLEFITLLIPAILSIMSPILTANVISDLTVYDFSKAIYDLSLDFGIIIVSAISYLLYHFVCTKINRSVITNLQDYVYENIRQNKNINKLSSNTMTGIFTSAEFEKNLIYKLCFLIKSVIILCIIGYYNIIISLIIVAVSLLTAFLFSLTNTKIQMHDANFSNLKAGTLELFNSIQQGAGVNENLNFEDNLKQKYFKYVDYSIKENNKLSGLYSINKNLISLILKSAAFALTVYLIFLVKSTALTLTLYLILTPYITSSASNLISFFEIFPEIGTVDNILAEFNALKFRATEEKVETPVINEYNITFFSVTSKSSSKEKLEKANFQLKFKKSYLFVGEEFSGKREIISLLERKAKPQSGSILIDDKNIYDFDSDTYNKIVATTSSKPYFYNISIYENLYLVCQNRSKILSGTKNFKLKPFIDQLPNKINTIASPELSPKLLFFLGILRAYLIDPKIICISEIPENFNSEDKKLLNSILKLITSNALVIVTSNSDRLDYNFSKVYYIDAGKIKNN